MYLLNNELYHITEDQRSIPKNFIKKNIQLKYKKNYIYLLNQILQNMF